MTTNLNLNQFSRTNTMSDAANAIPPSSSTEKLIKTSWPWCYLSACCMHNAWESCEIVDFEKPTHLCYKTQRAAVNTFWHGIQFQSGYTCTESPDQTFQTEPCISDGESSASPRVQRGLPFPSFYSQHWFDVNLDHLSCVNCTCAVTQPHWWVSLQVCVCVCVLPPSRPLQENGWMSVVHL